MPAKSVPRIEVKPLNKNGIGHEIVELSIRDILASKDLQHQITELLADKGLLLFRSCQLTPQEETEFLQLFDWDDESPFADVTGPYHTDGIGILQGSAAQWKIPGAPAVQLQGSAKLKDHYGISGNLVSNFTTREWHVDGAHDVPTWCCPPVVTSMYCMLTPSAPVGGETLFASGRVAFENLPQHLREQALQLDACYDRSFRTMQPDGCQAAVNKVAMPTPATKRYPIVIRDALGRPSLYVGPAFTQQLVDRVSGEEWSPQASQVFLGECLRQGLEDNIYQHRWDPLDFVIWSNRCMLHSPTESSVYEGQDRLFHRIRMASKTPVTAYAPAPCDNDVGKQQELYARLWALQQLLSSGFIPLLFDMSAVNLSKVSPIGFSMAGQTDVGFILTPLLWAAYVAVLCFPRNHALLTAAHLINMSAHAIKIPFLWDYELWDWLMELTLVTMGIEHGASLVRWQLTTFYFATSFYKLTRSFLSRKVSCAPIFVLALLDMMVPAGGVFTSDDTTMAPLVQHFVTALALTAPALTVLIEFAIPTLLLLAPGFGVLLGLLFHFLITIQPPPGNAGGFSISLAVRYVLFCRFGFQQAKKEKATWLWNVVVAVPFLTALVALGRSHGDDWAVPVHGLMILALVPVAIETGSKRFPSSTRPRGMRMLVRLITAITAIYAWGMPILGGDMGATTMFANLRVFSKSNHLVVPTGLFLNTTTVRVDFTTSDHINSVYPNEGTALLSPRLKTWLRSTGHTGRQFAPYLKRSLDITIASNDENDFVPYFIPDLELRRLVQEAFDAGERDFVLRYTKLPSLDQVLYHAMDDSCYLSNLSASWLSFRQPCSSDEAVLNPGLSFWQSKLLLFFPFPVESDTTEDIGISEVGCVC